MTNSPFLLRTTSQADNPGGDNRPPSPFGVVEIVTPTYAMNPNPDDKVPAAEAGRGFLLVEVILSTVFLMAASMVAFFGGAASWYNLSLCRGVDSCPSFSILSWAQVQDHLRIWSHEEPSEKFRPGVSRGQSLRIEKFGSDAPYMDIDGDHAVVATHSGYVIFFSWINAEIGWKRGSMFFHEEENDNDASVSISGTTAVVGFPDANDKLGLVYIYELNPTTDKWEILGDIPFIPKEPINPDDLYGFGTGVALDGDLLAVGASGANDFQGTVYLFHREFDSDENGETCSNSPACRTKKWVQKKQFVPPNLCEGAVFGGGIRLYGNTIAVGADCHEWMYLYQYYPESNLLKILQDPLVRSDEESLLADVSLSKYHFAHSTLFEGVYVYDRQDVNGPFVLRQFLNSSLHSDGTFGSHLSVDNDILAISGSNQIYIHTRQQQNSHIWQEILTFRSPEIEQGITLSLQHLAVASENEVFTVDLKVRSTS